MNQPQIDPGPRPVDTIPLQEAEVITTNWRNFISPLVPSGNYLRAFYIPMEDIRNLALFHNAIAVRAYLCLTAENDPSTAKVVLVPIDEKGNDILTIPPEQQSGDAVEDSAIYDFTQPCPQTCDFNSPLYDS